MRRLFTFGDSHTAYIYPTWANILGTCEDIDLYNCAKAGSDNLFMLQNLIRGIKKYNITKDDIVMVQFTYTDRIIYNGNEWNDIMSNILLRDKDFILNSYDKEVGVASTMDWAFCMKLLLDNIGCEYHIHPYRHIWPQDVSDDELYPKEKYHYYFNDIKEYDGHFTIEFHQKYVDKYYPNYKYDKDKVEEWCSMIESSKLTTEKTFSNIISGLEGKHCVTNFEAAYVTKEDKILLNKLKEL